MYKQKNYQFIKGFSIWLACKKNSFVSLIGGFLLVLCAPAFGQQNFQTNVRYIGVNDGLSHREVYSIGHDHEGLAWLGTRRGLDQFDGNRFLHFDFPVSFDCRNDIHSILEDENHVLWLISYEDKFESINVECINFFDVRTKVFYSWDQYLPETFPFSQKSIVKVKKIGKNQLIISLKDGSLYSFSSNTEFQEIFSPEAAYQHLFIEEWEGKYLYWQKKEGEEEWELIWRSPGKRELSTLLSNVREADINKFLFTQGEQGVYVIKKEKRRHLFYLLSEESLDLLHEETSVRQNKLLGYANSWPVGSRLSFQQKTGKLWLINNQQLLHINTADFQVQSQRLSSSPNSNSDFFYQQLDATEVLWLGTTEGLYLVDHNVSPFEQYRYNANFTGGLDPAFSCRGLLILDNSLIVNTYYGQYQIDLDTREEELLATIDLEDLPPLTSPYYFYPLIEGPAGSLIQAMDQIYLRTPGVNKLSIIPFADSLPENPQIWSLEKDWQQNLWVGQEKGLSVVPRGDSLIRKYELVNEFPEIHDAIIYDFFPYQKNQYLLGTSLGIFLFDTEEGILDRYHEGRSDEFSLPFNEYFHIHRASDGMFWLASNGGGLIKWDKESGATRQFTVSNGLSNDVLYAIYEDKRGFLWISSDFGIVCFNKEEETFRVYLEQDGITHHEFNRISHYQDENGILYFGSVNGVTSFNPLLIIPEGKNEIPLLLSRFRQFSKQNTFEEFTDYLKKDQQLVLRSSDRFTQFEFSFLDYMNNEKVKYYYKIEGFQEDWVSTEGNELILSRLPAGQYTLSVKAKSQNGVFSKNELMIPITVLKPWYRKFWVWLILIGILSAAVISFYFFRLYQLERKKNELEALVQLRTQELSRDKKIIERQADELKSLNYLKSKFFVNIAHELRTPLTLLFGPISSVLRSKELSNRNYSLLATAKQNLERILSLIEEILDLGKLEAGKLKINEQPFELHNLVQETAKNFKELANKKEIKFQIVENYPQNQKLVSDPEKLDKILVNFLSNAFRYTPEKGTIKLEVALIGKQLNMSVVDTGPGIPKEDLAQIFDRYFQSNTNKNTEGGTGLGLAICKEYAELLSGEVSVYNNEKEGSTFVLNLPVRLDRATAQRDSFSQEKAIGASKASKIGGETIVLDQAAVETVFDGYQIMVIEDNRDLQDYLNMVLSEQSFEVNTFDNGKEAWQYLNKLKSSKLPDLIITDLMMPEMDGLSFIKLLKQTAELSIIPIIVLTAKIGRKEKMEVLKVSIDDYLGKPFSSKELIARVKNVLRNYQQRLDFIRNEINNQDKLGENEQRFRGPHNGSWLMRVQDEVEKHIATFDFSAEKLAHNLDISRRQLYRRLKEVSGMTPHEYIQEIRLQKARELLEENHCDTVKEVAFEVGAKDVVNFSRNYKKRFGKLPSEYF